MVFLLFIVLTRSLAVRAEESSGKEFMMSCTYGVLAGTIVGAGMLAFTQKPGDNVNLIYRGASLGLYAGILLGLYVVYIVPGLDTPDEPAALGLKMVPSELAPTLSPNGVDGVQAKWTLTRF